MPHSCKNLGARVLT